MSARLLVPLDGSPLAEAVLPEIAELAAQRNGEIVLLRVVLAHALPGVDPVEAQVRVVEEAQAYLAKVEAALAARGLAVKSVVRYGHAAEEILDHARVGSVDMIAMSTHGRSGIRRWFLGSVAEAVVRRSPVPVLLVRALLASKDSTDAALGRPDLLGPSPPDISTPPRIRHVLCPVDLTPACRDVMAAAGALALRFDADLTILHAVYDPLDVTCSHIPHPPMEQMREEMIRVAEERLRRQVRRTLGSPPRTSLVVVAGSPFHQIIRFAQTHDIDLIVMGTEGRRGLDHVIMGSTAERVMRGAPCPVFSIRRAA